MKVDYKLIESLLNEAPYYATKDLPGAQPDDPRGKFTTVQGPEYVGGGGSPYNKPQYGALTDYALHALQQIGFDFDDQQQVQQLIAALTDQSSLGKVSNYWSK